MPYHLGTGGILGPNRQGSLDNPDLPVEFIQQILVARERMETEPFLPEDTSSADVP